jgi:HAD superfamily hydrolase (TIGR01509 family)
MIKDKYIFIGIELNVQYVFNLGTPKQLETYINNSYIFLFDLDGTMVLTENIYYDVWKHILNDYSYTLTEDIFKNVISGNTDEVVIGKLELTNVVSLQEISKKKDELFIQNLHKIKLIDGIENTLQQIKLNGHQLALVTNCNRQASNKILEITNLLKYFEFIIIGNECTRPKPFPDPYNTAINIFNGTSEKTIILEDSKTGLLSAYGVSPRCIVGIETIYDSEELLKSFSNITIKNFEIFNIDFIISHNYHSPNIIKKNINNSFNMKINNIEINDTKLKGGFISDVIDIKIYTDIETINCVGKMENKNENFLTKMSNNLELYNREYYFYKNISHLVPVKTPKFYGLINNENNEHIGVLLENINNDNHKLNLNLNQEDLTVSFKVIDALAKLHSSFWNKNMDEFTELRKNNNKLFNPFWNDFIQSKWDLFNEKWKHILGDNQLSIATYICKHFSSIQEKLSDKNLSLCHGDVKSANIFYKIQNDTYEPVFIDWQYIVLGKGVQDLVFFMIESFEPEKMKIYKNLFKEYYYVKLIENGVQYLKEDYENDFLNASYYFPFFVAIWFGTLNEDELIDKKFPADFIKKLFHFYTI